MAVTQQQISELENRTIRFSLNIISATRRISSDTTLRPVALQVVRSASSIGANYAEANNAISKADFKSKIYISKKEAAETKYWLRILSESSASHEGSCYYRNLMNFC